MNSSGARKRTTKAGPRRRASEAPPAIVLCLTGMPAAGKEEAVRVARSIGFDIVRMGDVVREEAARRGLPITDSAVGGMAHQDRVEHGFGIWAERTLPLLRGERILIDGLRGKAELEVYRRAFGDRLVVLAVHASPRTRYERVVRRARADDARTREAFLARDARELGWGLGEVIATADLLLVNEGSLEAHGRRVAKAIRGLGP